MGRRVGLLVVVSLTGWLVAVLGTVLGAAPGALPARAVPPPQTVEELVQRLREDPVQVNTMMGVGDSAQVHRALIGYTEQVPVPVYVVLDLLPQELEPTGEDDRRIGERLVDELAAELGDGLYVISLGDTAESIIGYRETEAVGVDEQLRSDFHAGSSHSYRVTDYSGVEPLRLYLGLRAVVEGPEAVEALDETTLRAQVPWAFPGSLAEQQETTALRLGATVVVPLVLLGLLTGGVLHLRRARRRTGRPARGRLRPALLLVGLPVIAAPLTFLALTPQVAPAPVAGEQEVAAAEAFAAGEHVWVSPDLAGWLSESQLEQIETAAAAGPVPTRVAVWYPTQETDGLELTARALGDPALYLGVGPDDADGFDFALAGEHTFWVPRSEAEADPVTATATALELLEDSARAGPRDPAPVAEHPVLGATPGATLGAASALGVLLAAVAAVVGWLLVLPLTRAAVGRGGASVGQTSRVTGTTRRSGTTGSTTWTTTTRTTVRVEDDLRATRARLARSIQAVADRSRTAGTATSGTGATGAAGVPGAAATVGAAGDGPAAGGGLVPRPAEPLPPGEAEGWTRSARYELGNLERTLRFLGPSAAASPAAETAGRHATAAARLLDSSTRPAEQLGALVLVRRGSQAAAAATALQPFIPTVGCWFHPEHPPGTQQRQFEGATVPCCARCAGELDSGREPSMLDLPGTDGEPVHFHRSGVEPWASTGFGATEPDLPARLDGPVGRA